MNEYFSAISSDNPSAEQPNDWAKMLMSVANQNNVWSAEQAQKQMDFQREMSNTAHQREIADLKAAGLNPVLSARLGGASTPTGAAGTSDSSIVSSLVSLMDKMLDVQGTSAAAAYNASGGSSGTYGSGSGEVNSGLAGKKLEDGETMVIPNTLDLLYQLTGNDVFRKEDFSWLGNKLSGFAASVMNGVVGKENPKDKYGNTQNGYSDAAQSAARIIVGDIPHSSITKISDEKFNDNKVGQLVTKVANGVKSFANSAKNFTQWLFTGKK